jgi:hypothetical protein
MKTSYILVFVVLGFFLLSLSGCAGQPQSPPASEKDYASDLPVIPPEKTDSNLPESEPALQPHELRTAETESIITLSRNVNIGPQPTVDTHPGDGGPRMTSESWMRNSNLKITGKLKEIELSENERYYYRAKYELVDSKVMWSIDNKYQQVWELVDGSICNDQWTMGSKGSEPLGKLNISFAYGEPFEAPGLGRLFLEIQDNGSYSLTGSFYVNMDVLQTRDCNQYENEYNGTEEFRIPVFGVSSGENHITGLGKFYNYGCKIDHDECSEFLDATGFIVETELVQSMTETEPSWHNSWDLYLP